MAQPSSDRSETEPATRRRGPNAAAGSAPVFSKGRDLEATRITLERWLLDRFETATDVQVRNLAYPVGSGLSNETILFEAHVVDHGKVRVEELALRVHPGEYQIFLEPDFRQQFDLLEVLYANDYVRVPQVRWFESDPSVLGHQFFVMRRMHGRVPISMPVYNAAGWLAEATPAERRRAWTAAMEQLCRIHLVPVDKVQFLDRPQWGKQPVEQQLNYWAAALSWVSDNKPSESSLQTLEWLRTTMPTDEEAGLSWGDARIGNVMFDDDFEVVGVMDWEQASLAGPMQDLAWWLQLDEHHSTHQGVPRLEGLGSRQETIDFWQDRVGRPVRNLHWHEVFTAFKLMVIGQRVGQLGGAEALTPTPGTGFEDRIPSLLDGGAPGGRHPDA